MWRRPAIRKICPTSLPALFSNKQSAGFTLGGYAESNPAETGKAAREALSMLARKEIHAEIHGVYPLEKAAEALTLLEQKNTVGKLVLKV
ncbi:zinc-binding dehydrogenase [Paenibacillus glucanolyticus]